MNIFSRLIWELFSVSFPYPLSLAERAMTRRSKEGKRRPPRPGHSWMISCGIFIFKKVLLPLQQQPGRHSLGCSWH